jgi:anti-sigma regulatory factor (Ser/Thr protein kinase)
VAPIAEQPADIVLTLTPDLDAVAATSRALREAGVQQDLEGPADVLATELVANAVLHAEFAANQRIVVTARLVDDYVRVEVADRGRGFDPDQALATEGHGLRLVDRLSSRWGVERAETGCRVWFEIDRRRRSRFKRSSAY